MDWDTEGDPDAVPEDGLRHADSVNGRPASAPNWYSVDANAAGVQVVESFVRNTQWAANHQRSGRNPCAPAELDSNATDADREAAAARAEDERAKADKRERRKVVALNKLDAAAIDVRRAFVTNLVSLTRSRQFPRVRVDCVSDGLMTTYAGPQDKIPPRLIELAALADSCRTAFLRTAAASHWQPAQGSYAAKVQAALAARDPHGFTLVSEVVVTYLEIAANHLGGLAVLYRHGEAMFPPVPIARSILELTAHVMWVLGDASGTADDILARAYLEELNSRETAKQAAGRMGSDAHQRAKLEWAKFRDHVIAVFPETTKSDLGENSNGRLLAGQVFPRPEASVEELFDLLHRNAGSSITARQGSGIYGFLSGGTHPSLYQARQLRRYVDHGDYVSTVLKADVAHLERLLTVPIIAHYNALSYTIDFYGLDRSAHDELTNAIDEVLPRALA